MTAEIFTKWVRAWVCDLTITMSPNVDDFDEEDDVPLSVSIMAIDCQLPITKEDFE